MEKNLPQKGCVINQLWKPIENGWEKLTTSDNKFELYHHHEKHKLDVDPSELRIVTLQVIETDIKIPGITPKPKMEGKELLKATINYILKNPRSYLPQTMDQDFIGISQQVAATESTRKLPVEKWAKNVLKVNENDYTWLRGGNPSIFELTRFVRLYCLGIENDGYGPRCPFSQSIQLL